MVELTCCKYLNSLSMCHWLHIETKLRLSRWTRWLRQMFVTIFLSVGKNWDFTAALSDFEQLRQVHAGNLTYSFAEERTYLPPEKEMARVGRPILHRQDEVVQGEATGELDVSLCCVM